MDSKKKITVSWSGGKDSAFALYMIMLSGTYEVVSLHTVINEDTQRVGMHGVHEALMTAQAKAIGLPLTKLYLEDSENHDAYAHLMHTFYKECAAKRIDEVVFGDIFLEDLKKFREDLLKPLRIQGIFPLWGIDTRILIEDFINTGFKTLVCAANALYFQQTDLGKTIDLPFLTALPDGVDPCGEKGEFHTFVYDGPLFKKPVDFKLGEVVKKTYHHQQINASGLPEKIETQFWFQDLLL